MPAAVRLPADRLPPPISRQILGVLARSERGPGISGAGLIGDGKAATPMAWTILLRERRKLIDQTSVYSRSDDCSREPSPEERRALLPRPVAAVIDADPSLTRTGCDFDLSRIARVDAHDGARRPGVFSSDRDFDRKRAAIR